MIFAKIQKNASGHIHSFSISGHADYADHGYDIVCSAISILTLNAINSIEILTDEKIEVKANEEDGLVEAVFPDLKMLEKDEKSDAQVILKSMEIGLLSIEKDYKDFVKIEVLK